MACKGIGCTQQLSILPPIFLERYMYSYDIISNQSTMHITYTSMMHTLLLSNTLEKQSWLRALEK